MAVEATGGTGPRNQGLDALRGLAAMAVVLFHYTTRYQEVYGHRSEPWLDVPWGHFGVQLFFGISGFVIFMTLDRTKSLLDFAASRASRLYPAYWAAILITTAVVALAGLDEFARSPWDLAINATMLQGFVQVPPVDGVYWTLSVELAFYCAMAALWKLRLLSRIELILLAWMALKWVWEFTPALLGFEPSWLLGALLIQDHIPFFAIGIAAYRWTCPTVDRRWLLLVFAGALLTVAVCDDLAHFTVAMISTAAITAVAQRRVQLLAVKPLLWLGAVSYSLYLVHQMVGFAMLLRLQAAGVSGTPAILITIAAMLALAGLVTLLVERPALRAVRSWYKSRKHRRSVAAGPVAAE
jgi:peptidoglycan/LPS O-acetylase OafA/YrhL